MILWHNKLKCGRTPQHNILVGNMCMVLCSFDSQEILSQSNGNIIKWLRTKSTFSFMSKYEFQNSAVLSYKHDHHNLTLCKNIVSDFVFSVVNSYKVYKAFSSLTKTKHNEMSKTLLIPKLQLRKPNLSISAWILRWPSGPSLTSSVLFYYCLRFCVWSSYFLFLACLLFVCLPFFHSFLLTFLFIFNSLQPPILHYIYGMYGPLANWANTRKALCI